MRCGPLRCHPRCRPEQDLRLAGSRTFEWRLQGADLDRPELAESRPASSSALLAGPRIVSLLLTDSRNRNSPRFSLGLARAGYRSDASHRPLDLPVDLYR